MKFVRKIVTRAQGKETRGEMAPDPEEIFPVLSVGLVMGTGDAIRAAFPGVKPVMVQQVDFKAGVDSGFKEVWLGLLATKTNKSMAVQTINKHRKTFKM